MRRKPPAKRQFGSTILVLEAAVIGFATMAAYGLRVADPGATWAMGGALVVALIVLSRMVARPGGYIAGWVAQGVVIACGFILPMMWVLGAVFAVLWAAAMRIGARIDHERAAWDAAHR